MELLNAELEAAKAQQELLIIELDQLEKQYEATVPLRNEVESV